MEKPKVKVRYVRVTNMASAKHVTKAIADGYEIETVAKSAENSVDYVLIKRDEEDGS